MFIKFILNKPYKHIIRGVFKMAKNKSYDEEFKKDDS